MIEGAGDAGWGQSQYPPNRPDGLYPADTPPPWDSRAHRATDSPAAVPPVDDPMVTFTCGPETAAMLAQAAGRTSLVRMRSRLRVVLLLSAWVFAGWCFADVLGALGVGLLIAVSLVLGRRKLRTGHLRFAGPGHTLSSTFGPDAVELHTADGRIRLRYDTLTAVLVQPQLVLLRGRGGFAAYPRELFPDYALDIVAAAAPALLPRPRPSTPAHLPDLPPIPPLANPTTTYTATSDTTDDLVTAMTSQRTRVRITLIVLGLILIVPGLWFRIGGTPDLLNTAVISGAAALFVLVMSPALGRILPTAAELRRELEGFTAPGRTMAVRLGPDAFDIRTDTFHYRIAYRTVRSLQLRGNATMLVSDALSSPLPIALFTAPTLAHLYTACPRLRRDKDRRR